MVPKLNAAWVAESSMFTGSSLSASSLVSSSTVLRGTITSWRGSSPPSLSAAYARRWPSVATSFRLPSSTTISRPFR